MKEIYEVLTAIEPEAVASLAARKLPEKELKPLIDATARMEQALEDDDLEAWADADDEFHKELLVLHGNKRLLSIASLLFDLRASAFSLRPLPGWSRMSPGRISMGVIAGSECAG